MDEGLIVNIGDSTLDDRKIISGDNQLVSTPIGGYVKVQVTINDNKNNRTYDIYSNLSLLMSLLIFLIKK